MRVVLIGHPVGHSLSPAFQNAGFAALGLAHRYETWDLARFDAVEARRVLDEPDVLGANVTVPHKEAARQVADQLTAEAMLVGAVNTFYRAEGDAGSLLVGHNTDLGGFLADLDTQFPGHPLGEAVVVGAGGAARGVVAALARRGVAVAVVNRTAARAEHLVASIRAGLPAARLTAHGLAGAGDDAALIEALARADLAVDATSLGLGARPGDAAFEAGRARLSAIPWDCLAREAVAYDVKYAPSSPFLSIMRAGGRRTATGVGMLLRQGTLAFECWTGLPAPVAVMRRALVEAVEQRFGGR